MHRAVPGPGLAGQLHFVPGMTLNIDIMILSEDL